MPLLARAGASRTRRSRWLWAAPLAGAVLLAGCGTGGGAPQPQAPQENVTLTNVQTKLDIMQQDPCYRKPDTEFPRCAGRYLRQVANLAHSARSVTAGTPVEQQAGEVANTVNSKVNEFNGLRCTGEDPPDAQRCRADLGAIDGALKQLGPLLARVPQQSG